MSGRTSTIKEGDRFGRLLVIRKLPKDEFDNRSIKRSLYLCLCDCGTEKIIDAGNLKKAVKSCGCWQKENARIQGQKQRTEMGFLNDYWGEYRRTARNRGWEFDLTREDFISLVTSDCTYCGVEPKIRDKQNRVGIPVPVNGVDRVDSNKGYIVNNTVSCCEVCNRMKLNYTKEDFILQCLKIVENYGTQLEHQDVAIKCKEEVVKYFPFLKEVMEK